MSDQVLNIIYIDSLGEILCKKHQLVVGISLMVGVGGAFVAVLIGTLYGATPCFIMAEPNVMMRILEILHAVPFMFLVIVLVTFLPKHVLIFVAIGAIAWLAHGSYRASNSSLRSKKRIY